VLLRGIYPVLHGTTKNHNARGALCYHVAHSVGSDDRLEKG